jgi:uncharacterized protein YfaS (alpha-2-macroglobulin family)
MRKMILILGLLLGVAIFIAACNASITETSVPTATRIRHTATRTPLKIESPTPTPTGWTVEVGNINTVNGYILPGGPLVLLFNHPMQVPDSSEVLQFSPHVEGKTEWNPTMDTLVFTPDTGFKTGTAYTVYFDPDLTSEDGDRAFESRLKFQVLAAPGVANQTPESSQLSRDTQKIDILFDRAMDKESVSDALEVQPNLQYDLSWVNESKMQIEFTESLSPGMRYQFTLADSAADTLGMTLEAPYRWTYWIEEFEADLGMQPEYGDKQIKLTFNYAADKESVESALVTDPALAYSIKWLNDHTANLLLDSPPQPGMDYELRFDHPIVDANGNELGIPKAVIYSAPPPIFAVWPLEGSTLDWGDEIRVLFDTAMDHESVEQAFEITPAESGYFTWDGNELLFHFTSTLSTASEYTVSLQPPIQDAQGEQVLSRPYTWSFSTNYYPYASFGWIGSKIQLLDTEGLRAVQFSIMSSERTRIFFELHELSVRQFVELCRDDPGFVQPELENVSGESELVERWEITTGLEGEHWNIKQVYLPEDVPAGIYMLSMEIDGVLQDHILVMLSQNTLVAKYSGKDLFVWLTDIHGEVVPDAEIRVYTTEGSKIRESHTDKDGIYQTTIPENYEPMIVVARQGEHDVTAVGVSSTWSSTWSYWDYWMPPAPYASRYLAYIYTDRPIYRPGQTVEYKAILRQEDDMNYSLLPTNTPVEVRVRDARGNLLESTVQKTNTYGSIYSSFSLTEGTALGDYTIEVNLEGNTFEGHFKVQDYHKPDLQINISSDATSYVLGDEITVNVKAEYLFGEPVKNAKITIQEYELGEFYGYYWEESDEEDAEYAWFPSSKNAVNGKTDANGEYTYHRKATLGYEQYRTTSWRSSQSHSTWGIEVTIDDGSHQTISDFIILKVYDSAEKIALSTSGYIHAPGSEFDVEVSVNTIEDQPVPDHPLRLEILTWDSDHRGYKTINETYPASTGDNGVAHIPVTLNENGHYKLVLTAEDDRGNEITLSNWVAIYDFNFRRMTFNASDDITIWADKDSYSPYQTANLYIQSTIAGPAILTFERGKVHRAQEITLTPPITQVQVPILESDAPNIFVTVNTWQPESTVLGEYEFANKPESRLYGDTIELQVDAANKLLNLEIETDRSTYGPGEDANVTIRVTDAQGNPVRAEVSLALVDEGIYALSNVLVDPITEAFYGPREYSVRTFDSMSLWREIYSPGRGGGGGGDAMPSGNPRAEFQDTAAWFPVLITDAQGEVTVAVPLPDNLTTWRLTARAITTNSLVGEVTANIVTQQAIVIRPILPGILTSGDQLTLTASVHNYSDTAQSMAVEVSSDKLEITDLALQNHMIPAGEAIIVGWSAVADEAGEAEITITAEGDGVADAIRQTVTIQPLAIPEVTTQVGSIEDEFDTIIFLPPDSLDQSNVYIELSRSIEGNLLSGLEYLTGYPYGCVEQIMSKALPNAVVGRALYQIGHSDQADLLNLQPKISASLQSLYAMQHQDGGWGWWYDDQTDGYQTAWVVFGLAMTAEAGYEVDEAVVLRGVEWLQNNLDQMDPKTEAFALYSMAIAGHGDYEASLALYQHNWIELDTFSQAALAITLDKLEAPAAASEILLFLEDSVFLNDAGAYWPSPHLDGHYHKKTMSSSIRSTALTLSAFIRIDPDNELTPEIVRWLTSQRQKQGWGTTNETSFTLMALSDYLLIAQKAEGQSIYQIELDGEIIIEGALSADQPVQTVEISSNQLSSGCNRLKIYNIDNNRMYYIVSTQLYRPTAQAEAAGSIEITREYRIFGSANPHGTPTVGNLVQVILTVDVPEDSSYIIIEDKLPGGLEAVNEGLNTTSHAVDYYGNPQYSWHNLGYNYKEIHKDRVSFFITELTKGEYRYVYFCRVIHAGTFLALPAEAWEMYNPSNWGRSASDTLEVQPMQ